MRTPRAAFPKGFWITGGDYGAPSAWAAQAKGAKAPPLPVIRLDELDAVSPEHPVLLKRVDGARFANSHALRLARFTDASPNPRGGSLERDPRTGRLTGLLLGRAADRLAELMPPPAMERKLAGAHNVLKDFARYGVTSIGDIARLPAASERARFPTHYERSATNIEIFRELQRRGELTVRVTAHLTLRLHAEVKALGVKPWSDDGLIRYGGLKAYIDGYLMEDIEPPERRGDFTFRFPGEEAMARDIREADLAGFDPLVHTIGERAHRLLLNWYEEAIRKNPVRDRRFRIIHAEYPSTSDIARMGRMKLIVDVTPTHLLRDLKAVERRAGDRLATSAYAWRSMIASGVRLNLVSDMPGSFNEQESKPFDPIELIADAVNRQPLTETGDLGPAYRGEEGLTVQEAIAAMTANPAYSSFEESRKGVIKPGLLADLVVLSQDILALPKAQIRRAKVDFTILGGKAVYRRSPP